MSEETVADSKRTVCTVFKFLQKVLTVKIIQLFQIPKYGVTLSAQILRQVDSLHLWEVLIYDVSKGLGVLSLCANHFFHDVLQLATGK